MCKYSLYDIIVNILVCILLLLYTYMCFNVCVLLCEYTFLWVGVGVCMCVCMHALECQCACLLPQQSIGHLWAGPVDNMHNCVLLLRDTFILHTHTHTHTLYNNYYNSIAM